MRRFFPLFLPVILASAPLGAQAQVTVDLNALDRLGGGLPVPPESKPHHLLPRHRHRALARSAPIQGKAAPPTAVATGTGAGKTPPSSVSALTTIATAPPPLPAPMSATPAQPKPWVPPPLPGPEPKAAAVPPAVKPAAPEVNPPELALPGAAPALPAPRLATATPPLPAASPPTPGKPTPATVATSAAAALPPGSDKITLPFLVQDTDLPPAEQAMLRDFARNRSSRSMQYVVSAYAAAAAGDDDPSTPRRLALSRAQAVQAALLEAGVPGGRIRLLALGDAGGSPPNRVEVVASPSGAPPASPSPSSATH
jgi:hypothetical protein